MRLVLVSVRPGYTSRAQAGAGEEEVVVEDSSVGRGRIVNGVFAGGGEIGGDCGVGFCCWGGVETLWAEAEGEDAG